MDKEKFIKWIDGKVVELSNDSTLPLETDTQKAYIRGFIKSLEGVKELINEGHFDK